MEKLQQEFTGAEVKVVILYLWAMRTCGTVNGYESDVNIQHETSEIQTLQRTRLEKYVE
jgi:hypothetical protein